MLRVLHLSTGNLYGGVERLLATLARNRGISGAMQPEFALCFDGRLATEIRATKVPLHLLGAVRVRHPLTVFQARRRLESVIRAGRFDLVVCHSVWPLAIFGAVLSGSGLPLVFWLHDYPTGPHWLERWARLTRPDLVICNSHSTAASANNICPGVEARILYYPIELSSCDISSAARSEIRAELTTPLHSTVIIQVSRMEPWKGHVLHLEALQRLLEVPEWICWIVGGPQRPFETRYYERLKRLATRHGIANRVRFVGFRTDIPRLLAAADVLSAESGAGAFWDCLHRSAAIGTSGHYDGYGWGQGDYSAVVRNARSERRCLITSYGVGNTDYGRAVESPHE